jgi:hypothetical protein
VLYACVIHYDHSKHISGGTCCIDIIITNFQPQKIEIERVLLMMPKVAQLPLGQIDRIVTLTQADHFHGTNTPTMDADNSITLRLSMQYMDRQTIWLMRQRPRPQLHMTSFVFVVAKVLLDKAVLVHQPMSSGIHICNQFF